MDTVALCPSPANNPADLERLYVEHGSFVRSVLLGHGVPTRDVEDGVQDVFVLVQPRIIDLDPTHSPRPWLYVFATRVASNYRRSGRVRFEQLANEYLDEPLSGLIETAEDAFIAQEERRQLLTRIQKLRPKQRAVLIAHDLEERPMPEIASSLGIPLKTAYARLRLSRKALARSSAALRSS
jgi:RNA polymerase sigma-70 factor, ECF subfamily